VSALRQVIGRKDEAFDSLTGYDPFHDFGQISHGNVTVEEVIGLDQDANTARALIEAARLAGPRLEPGQSPSGKLFLERRPNFFGAANGARTLRIIIRAAVGADKEIVLSQRHAAGWQSPFARSTSRIGGGGVWQ
jgi:hypothetical protein